MNNLTHAERATLNIVFDTFPDDLTFNEVLGLIPARVDDKTRELIFNEPFGDYMRGVDLKIEIFRIQGVVIDALIAHAQERHESTLNTVRGGATV
jgi:hypothetical protein